MPRKKGIRNKKTDTPEYWNKVLAAAGLSIDAGRSKRISYVGDASDIEMVEGFRRTDTGVTRIEEEE